jgi:heptosyltransferase I
MLTAIGDAVQVLPVANALKRHSPGIEITWLLQPGPAALVRGHPAIDEVLVFDRKRGLRAFLEMRRALAARRFDVVLALQPYFKAAVLTGFARAPVKLGYDRARARDLSWLFTNHRIPPREPQHVQDQYFEFLQALGVPAEPVEWGLESTPDERARYDGILPPAERPTVGLILATSKAEKDWAAERYVELVDRLEAELGVATVLLGAPSARERAAADLVLERTRSRPLDLLAWDLRRLTYLIERVDVLVSPDTGPMHIGVSLGTPTVGLLGYSSPKWCGPYRFQDLMVDAFGDPGEDYPPGRIFRPGRMGRITVDQVVEKVALALERYPRSASGQPAP